MSFKRKNTYMTAAAVLVTAVFSLGSCRGDSSGQEDANKGRNYFFTSVISGSPATLDPQTCANDSSAQIIANVFRGLYRVSDGGSVEPAMAESTAVSDDGLTWTFTLSDNISWYAKDGFTAECTADDFVFAFQRLMNPALRSGRAKEYYCIHNAEKINTGKISDPEELGVEAIGKYELRITLDEPRTDFEALLAAAPAMPCSRSYYEHTEGQYGLVGDCVGSNGSFYVSRWHYDKWVKDGNFIELRRNEANASALDTAPRGVTFMINEDGYENFVSGVTDVCRTADPEKVFKLSGKYDVTDYSTSVWGVMFNTKGVFESSDLRIALGGYVGGTFDGDNYTAADCIVPDGIPAGTADYRIAAGYPEKQSYSDDELRERGERAMRGLPDGALSGMKLIIPEGTALKQEIGSFIQQWQKNFGIYCMISELPYDSYMSALSSGSFDAAMVRIGGGPTAASYLRDFSSSSSANYGGVKSHKFDDILNSTLTAENESSAARYCLEAEQFILDNGYFAPLCFEKEHVFLAGGVSGIGYDPFGGVYIFGGALKK